MLWKKKELQGAVEPGPVKRPRVVGHGAAIEDWGRKMEAEPARLCTGGPVQRHPSNEAWEPFPGPAGAGWGGGEPGSVYKYL